MKWVAFMYFLNEGLFLMSLREAEREFVFSNKPFNKVPVKKLMTYSQFL